MTQTSDIHAAKITLIGALGVIVTVAVTLAAAVSYFAGADRVERLRSDEAAVRIQRQVEQITAGKPVAQPWLNADLQRATQEAQLAQYARRTITGEDGSERIVYAVPIEQAMASVLKEATDNHVTGSHPKEVGP